MPSESSRLNVPIIPCAMVSRSTSTPIPGVAHRRDGSRARRGRRARWTPVLDALSLLQPKALLLLRLLQLHAMHHSSRIVATWFDWAQSLAFRVFQTRAAWLDRRYGETR